MKHSAKILLSLLLVSACSSAPVTGDTPEVVSGETPEATSGGTPGGQIPVEASSSAAQEIVIDSPIADAVVKSPLTITGKAVGSWYFEANLPVRLLDEAGVEIATGHADAQGDWMTADFVPFTATLKFTTTAKTGVLVVQKDNPSGLPENDKSVAIPVKFE